MSKAEFWSGCEEQAGETAQVPEEPRKIEEISYDCWESTPLREHNQPIYIYQEYESLDNLGASVTDTSPTEITIKQTEYESIIGYKLNPKELGLPEDVYPSGMRTSWDIVKKRIKWIEQLNIEEREKSVCIAKLLEAPLKELEGHAVFSASLSSRVGNLDEDRSIAYKTYKITHEMGDYQSPEDTSLSRIKNLQELVGEESPTKLVEVLAEKILEETKEIPCETDAESRKKTEIVDSLEKILKEPIIVHATDHGGTSPLPNPAFYFDKWEDPRFVTPIEGTIASGVVIAEEPRIGDLDYSASEKLLQMGFGAITTTEASDRDNTILHPPNNLTNLYVVNIPAKTAAIKKFEEEHNLEKAKHQGYKSSKLRLIFCETPERLNPNKITKELSSKYGEGGWLIIKSGENGMEVVTPKPKKDWKIESKFVSASALNNIIPGFVPK